MKHQTQPTPHSCASTVLAMILDVPAQEVIDEFQEGYFANTLNELDYLASKGVAARAMTRREDLYYGRVYIATAPSLNVYTALHSLIIDTRGGSCTVWDPNKGRRDRMHYVWAPADWNPVFGTGEFEHEDPLAVPLFGYVVDFDVESLAEEVE